MKNETMTHRTRLIIDLRQAGDAIPAADGYVIEAGHHRPDSFAEDHEVAVVGEPGQHEDWMVRANTVWLAPSLGDAVRLRDRHPGLTALPIVGVRKATTSYSCGDPYPGEGFRCYVPDTAVLRGYQVSDRDLGLVDWLHQAISYGFETVWLASVDGEERGRGFDLEMLDRARTAYPGSIWLSGGARTPEQIERLRDEGGTRAAVLPARLAVEHDAERLLIALGQPPAVEQAADGQVT